MVDQYDSPNLGARVSLSARLRMRPAAHLIRNGTPRDIVLQRQLRGRARSRRGSWRLGYTAEGLGIRVRVQG